MSDCELGTSAQGEITLSQFRKRIAALWLVIGLGVGLVVSQVSLFVILNPLGTREFFLLQCTTITTAGYIARFEAWEASGLMPRYHAHLILDRYHWMIYTAFFRTLLAWLFERLKWSDRGDPLLLLPVISGLCDFYENQIQEVFLGSPNHAMIVAPLPLFSAIASNIKWGLAIVYVAIAIYAIGLCLREK